MAQLSDTLFKCYVCDQPMGDGSEDIYLSCTENTKTPIHELLEQFLGHSLSRTAEKNCCCLDCLSRINDYDLACFTAHQVQKELTDLLNATNERYCKKDAIVSDEEDDSHEQNDFDNSKGSFADIIEEQEVEEDEEFIKQAFASKQPIIRVVKQDAKVEFDEETDEYELRFFSATGEIDRYEDVYESDADEDGVQYNYKIYTNSIDALDDDSGTTSKMPSMSEFPAPREPPNYCLQCERNFETKDLLREHRRTIHKKPPKLHTCDVCGITYKLRNALRVHMLMHTGVSPFQCDVCGKKFTQKGALKRHMPIHTGECRYQCEKCGKQFIHYSSFHMHNLAHDDVRKKKCDVCGLLLRSNSHLKRHLQVHTGAKPHKCPKCDKTFAQRYNMMTHLRSHQGLPRKRKHTCPVCERVFTKETSLQDHLNTGVCRAEDTTIIDLYNSMTTTES